MKRTPLVRKTPLRRSATCTLKKTKLKPMSSAKAEWKELYKERKRHFTSFVRCAASGLLMSKDDCEPHHPFGQVGARIMAFLWVSKAFHRQIHDFGKQAYTIGWLQPEFRGAMHDDNWPRPWSESHESGWPDLYKRKPELAN